MGGWRVKLLNFMAEHPLPTPGRAMLGVGVVAAPLLLGGGVWWGLSIRDAALSAKADLTAAREAFAPREPAAPSAVRPVEGATVELPTNAESLARFDQACSSAGSAHQSLERIRGQIGLIQPVVGALDLLPGGLGTRAKTQGAMLDAGAELAAVGAALCRDLRPVASVLGPQGEAAAGGSLAESLRQLAAARPSLLETADRLERLGGTLKDVPDDAAEGKELAQVRARAPELAQTLRDSATLLALIGGDRPTRFLLVSQNPDELRPTGGYIGSAGVVELNGGALKLLEYGTSRQYDTPGDRRAPVPADIAPFLRGSYWHLAAANWWPSFPDAARQIEYFYGLARPDRPVDGVIAIDQYGLALVLEALGPVDVPEYGERVGAADVQAAIDRHVHVEERDEWRRKQFTAALTAAVMRRALEAPSSDLPKLAKAARTALDRQQLIVSVRDPGAAQLFARKGWDGRLLEAPGDYLLITDTELTASKHSQQVRRDVTYSVDLADAARPVARLELTYANGSRDTGAGRFVPEYRTYVRVHAPAGARLLGAEGFDAPPTAVEDCGRASFGAPLTITAGTTSRVTLTYALPARVVQGGAYDLVVQHQPGVPPGTVSLRVGEATAEATAARGEHLHWRLPPGGQIEPAPRPASSGRDCGRGVVEAAPIAPPTGLEIPSIGVDAPVTPLGVGKDGLMQDPTSPDVVGWYAGSARAGQPGNSVMSGHVDWRQSTAVFWDLRKLEAGDEIRVRGQDGQIHTYTVDWNRAFAVDEVPKREVLEGTDDATLTLITCDGQFDPIARDYSHRRAVRASIKANAKT